MDPDRVRFAEPRRRSLLGCYLAASAIASAFIVTTPNMTDASSPGVNGTVAFTRGSNAALWTMDPDGSNEQQIPGTQGVTDPSFSPDGKMVAYTAGDSPDDNTGAILVFDLEGDGPRVVVPEDDQISIWGGPTWSPDGSMLAYSLTDPDDFTAKIRVVDSSTGATVATLQSPETVDVEGDTFRGNLFSPSWSPTSTDLLVVQHNRPFDPEEGGFGKIDIATVTLDGSLTNVTDDSRFDGAPDWSPDGERIAYISVQPDGSGGVIRTVGSAGGGMNQVTATPATHEDLVFSPDGNSLLIGDGVALYSIDADAHLGSPTPLPGGDGERNDPAWAAETRVLLLSGSVLTTDCSETACEPEPFAGVVVRASGSNGSGDAVTGVDGTYVIALEKEGAYIVTPSVPDQPGQGFRPASRSVYLKEDKVGVDFKTCSAETVSSPKLAGESDEPPCYSVLVEDLNGSGHGGGSLGDFAELDVPPVNLRFQGIGWKANGGPITVFWQGQKIKTYPSGTGFRGKLVAEFWPERARYGSIRPICGGTIAARQGGATRRVQVLAGAGAIVVFADREPVLRTGDFICAGEYKTVLKKTPGTIISSDRRGDRLIVSKQGENTPELIFGGSLCVDLTKGRGHVVVRRVDDFLEVSGRRKGRCK